MNTNSFDFVNYVTEKIKSRSDDSDFTFDDFSSVHDFTEYDLNTINEIRRYVNDILTDNDNIIRQFNNGEI